jgi:metal-responsive CopG/Arc/MetJ family transcriptional regulator
MARVLISLPDDFLAEIDAIAKQERRSRSELIREALRAYMAVGGKSSGGASTAIDSRKALDEIQRIRRDAQPSAGETSEAWLAARRNRHG